MVWMSERAPLTVVIYLKLINQRKPITFGMVTKGGSEVPVDQSDPIFVVAEGPGTDAFLFCMLSIP